MARTQPIQANLHSLHRANMERPHNWKSISMKVASYAVPFILFLAAVALITIPFPLTFFAHLGLTGMVLKSALGLLSMMALTRYAEKIYDYFDRKAEELKTSPQYRG